MLYFFPAKVVFRRLKMLMTAVSAVPAEERAGSACRVLLGFPAHDTQIGSNANLATGFNVSVIRADKNVRNVTPTMQTGVPSSFINM